MATANLVNQSEALVDFLDDLLSEEIEAESVQAESVEAQSVQSVEQEVQQGIDEVVIPEPVITDEVETPQFVIEEATGRKLVIPAWGRQTFSAMVFKVRDLSLAIPVKELAGVIDWQAARVEQQAGSMLLLGQSQHAGQNVSVIDTARFIFSESKLTELSEQGGKPSLSRIILINNGNIGLACDEVYELIDIDPSQVRWRSDNTRRKWLAGTMLNEMIVLLDAATAADILAEKLAL